MCPIASRRSPASPAYSIGHNIGATAFSGGAIRYRIYSQFGLGVIDVAKICFLTGLTFLARQSGGAGVSAWRIGRTGRPAFSSCRLTAVRGIGIARARAPVRLCVVGRRGRPRGGQA